MFYGAKEQISVVVGAPSQSQCKGGVAWADLASLGEAWLAQKVEQPLIDCVGRGADCESTVVHWVLNGKGRGSGWGEFEWLGDDAVKWRTDGSGGVSP